MKFGNINFQYNFQNKKTRARFNLGTFPFRPSCFSTIETMLRSPRIRGKFVFPVSWTEYQDAGVKTASR